MEVTPVAIRVLVVDDDPDALALIQMMLRRRGYEVQTASGGAEALEMLAHDLPDLVVLDLMMPFMDGHEVCARLRADPRTASLPIVMLTAKPHGRVESIRLGADDYVVKPVHPDELSACLRAVLARAAQAREPQSTRGSIVGCIGCKGGLGTTTVAVNVALTLATHGRAALVDFAAGDTLTYLGQRPAERAITLSQLDVGQIERSAIERAWFVHSNTLYLLYDADLLMSRPHAEAVLERLPDMVDFAVLDLGAWSPAAPASQQWIIERCNSIALMVTSGDAEVERALKFFKQLDDWQMQTPVNLVMVTRWKSSSVVEAAALGERLGRKVAHIIPYSPGILVAAQPNIPAADAIRNLADSLVRGRG